MLSTLILVLAAQDFPDPQQVKPPTDDELKGALQIYRQFELPLPPAGAELIAYPDGAGYGDEKTRYSVGFRFRDPAKGGYRYIVGLNIYPSDEDASEERRLKSATTVTVDQLKRLEFSDSTWSQKFEADSTLAFSIQVASTGDLVLAKEIAGRTSYSRSFNQTGTFESRTYCLVAAYLFTQYVDPSANTALVIESVREIFSKLPGKDDDTWGSMEKWIARGILLAHEPTKSRPGTDEHLIDSLVNYGVIKTDGFPVGYGTNDEDPYMRAILLRGKAIVPTLIAHMDDERATRAYVPRFNNANPHIKTIGSLCSNVVGTLTSSRFVNRGWADRDEVEEWWKEASKLDEESLLKRAIFFHEEDSKYEGDESDNIPLNSIPLIMYVLRYPSKLDELYIESLNWKRNSNSELAYMIEESSLSDARKLELFKTAAEKGSSGQQATASRLLEKYDPAAALDALKRALKQDDPFGKEMHGDMRASSLAAQVFRTKDQEAIDLLIAKAKARDTGIRMNLISGMHEAGESRSLNVRDLAIAGLRKFLSDSSIHKTSVVKMRLEEFDDEFRWDPSDLWEFENPISVRDYAAWCIGRLLEFPVEPEKTWGTKDWTNYRAMIEDKLKGNSLPVPAVGA